MSADVYQGYGNCKRCGDRWPILYRINKTREPYLSPMWVAVDGWISEEEHEQLHGSLAGRARLAAYWIARKLGFRLAAWPGEQGR